MTLPTNALSTYAYGLHIPMDRLIKGVSFNTTFITILGQMCKELSRNFSRKLSGAVCWNFASCADFFLLGPYRSFKQNECVLRDTRLN